LKINTLDTISRSLSVLPKYAKKRFVYAGLIQIFLGFLDLLGLALISGMSAIAIHGINSTSPGAQVESVLRFLRLQSYPMSMQLIILGLSTTLIFVLKTFASIFLLRQMLKFLGNRGAELSSNLVSKLLNNPVTEIQKSPTQETLFAITGGTNSITVGVLGSAISLISDFALVLIILSGVIFFDPLTAILSLGVFSLVAISLHTLTRKKAKNLGDLNASLTISSSEAILEVLASFREAFVRDRRFAYSEKITDYRWRHANVLAELSILPNMSKYIMDVSLILGTFLVATVQFRLHNAPHAVAGITLFLSAGTRLAPALLRIQQGITNIIGFSGSAQYAFDLVDRLERVSKGPSRPLDLLIDHEGFTPEVILKNVCYTYPNTLQPIFRDVNLNIVPGQLIAICGSSGAGKSTLVDLILGLLPTDSGSVVISGLPPETAIYKWPGSIGYVPQEVYLASTTIRQNIALGYPATDNNDEQIWKCLENANLSVFVSGLPLGIDTVLQENGNSLSGGQRQRLGIARALYTNPKLVVLDEATSALDSESEQIINSTIQSMRGSKTVILIAHRLASVRNADQVLFMDSGKLVASGTFEEVRKIAPNFDRQAKLMGL